LFLDKIVKEKYKEIEERKKNIPLEELKRGLDGRDKVRDFKRAITRGKDVPIRLIAEIKHFSPLGWIIREDFVPSLLAKAYEDRCVAAISVLTDRNFGGELTHLKEVRETVTLPLLRKDFILDPYQIYEARLNGADAVLLIAAILKEDEINNLISLSNELKMAALVEVHNESELDKALKTEAQIIGINNRNLYTFTVDLKTTLRLKPLIPPSKIVVSESGISTHEEILLLKEKEIDAVLIGEAILRSKDVGSKIDKLLGR